MTCKDCIHSDVCYKENDYEDFPDKCGDFISVKVLVAVRRPKGEWIVTAEDNEGIHRIQCPFCRYEKGSDFTDYITVTFERMPPFCENCGADMRKEE